MAKRQTASSTTRRSCTCSTTWASNQLPGGCEDFVRFVTPELQRRGRFRTAYEGRTLRENLGLKPHVNRYVAQREAERLASN